MSGSCFCCDFPALLSQARALRDGFGADVILAEPVGSCTDLSATILQPLKHRHAPEFRLARLSVLVDPHRIDAALDARRGDLHPDAAYILRKQMEEADLILLDKTEALTATEDVDYDRYAQGEAGLGWLNARSTLTCTGPVADWESFCAALMGRSDSSRWAWSWMRVRLPTASI